MTHSQEVSPLTLNRLSVYLRCLRQLRQEGMVSVSSQELADRFRLSSAQIRRDLATFGEFGVRGVGYDVASLTEGISRVLKLDVRHRLIIVGMGNLGSALAGYFGFNDQSFQVVAGIESDPARIGRRIGAIKVESLDEIPRVVAETEAEIGILAVPAEAAQLAYERLVEAGVRSILNFAPILLRERDGVRLKNVDMRIHLEEMAFFLADGNDSEDLDRAG